MADVDPVVPTPPTYNKAVVAALVFLVIVVKQWLTSDEFDFSEEGLTAIIGAIGTIAVWAQSNFKTLFNRKPAV
jgi:hypothetical protein